MSYRLHLIIRVVGILALIIFISTSSVYALFNIEDWKNPILNPAQKQLTAIFYLPYPLQSENPTNISSQLALSVTLNYSDPIVENQPVNFSVQGDSIGNDFAQNISLVVVSFTGSSQYTGNDGITAQYPPAGISLYPKFIQGIGYFLTPTRSNFNPTICWRLSGNYAPTLTLWYSNQSSPHIASGLYSIQTYPEYSIQVGSTELLNQEKDSRINTVVSAGLFVFAIVESVVLAIEIRPKHEKSPKNQNSMVGDDY